MTLADLPGQVRVAWQGHLLSGVFGGLWYLALTRAQRAATRCDDLPKSHAALNSSA